MESTITSSLSNHIKVALKRFVVYLVVLAQITIPTVQASDIYFDLEDPNSENDYTNFSLWIWEQDSTSDAPPLKTELKYDSRRNTLQDVVRNDQNKLSSTK